MHLRESVGVKRTHGTELSIITLIEYIELYRKGSTIVFVTFLDASKVLTSLTTGYYLKK